MTMLTDTRTNFITEFARLLCKYKDTHGVSIRVLAKKLDCSVSDLHKWLHGTGSVPSAARFSNIATTLGFSPSEINRVLNLTPSNVDEASIFEDLYYKENAKVGLLKTQVDALKAQVTYLNAKQSFAERYPE